MWIELETKVLKVLKPPVVNDLCIHIPISRLLTMFSHPLSIAYSVLIVPSM